MAGTNRSWKNIWALLSEKSVLKSTKIIGTQLEENTDALLNGFLYYKKANTLSAEAKQLVPDFQQEFVVKLSRLIDVDIIQCFNLFQSYLQYEYKGTKPNLKSLLGNERQEQSLLFQMWNFYYSERLSCILTLKHILEHWHDANDEYKILYEDFLSCVDKDRIVLNKIFSQLEALQTLEVPNKDTNGPYMNDVLVHQWVMSILKEHSEVLQLVLLYYKHVEPTVDEVKRFFSICQKHGFGTRQPFRQYLNETNISLVNSVRYVESLTIIRCFRLDLLCFAEQQEPRVEDHFLLKSEESLKSLDSIVQILGCHECHGPILLAWMLIGQISESPSLSLNSHKYGNIAIQINVYDYILKVLRLASANQSRIVSSLLHLNIYHMLFLLLSQFELHTLGSLDTIFKIAMEVFKYPEVAADFWEKDVEQGLGILLKTCIEKFPTDFRTLIDLCSPLAQASKSSSSRVLLCMKNLPVICEFMDSIDMIDIAATNEQSGCVFRLLKDRWLYGDPNIHIPVNTLGIVTSDQEKSQSTMQWQAKTNGWQICLWELHIKLQEISVCMGAVDDESLSKVISVTNLVHNLLSCDVSSREPLRHIINMLFSILQRLIMHPTPPLNLMAKCLDIATLLFDGNSELWVCLVHMDFLPSLTGVPRGISELSSGTSMSMGILCVLIASKECVLGRYPLCISFLKLIAVASQNIPEKGSESFLACILYILREIFSSFHKWRYVDQNEKITIGQTCLNLFHNIFTIDKSRKSKILEKIEEMCIYNLLYCEAGQTLLRIVCTGEEAIHHATTKINRHTGKHLAVLIRLSLSVLNRLLLLKNRSAAEVTTDPTQHSVCDSPFEKVLFSNPSHTEQPQVVLTVANYAFQHYNPRLATLAVQLLKRFAKQFPMSLLACFGSAAESIRDHFLTSLSSQYGDIRLKVSILEFLTVCIAHQPGLTEMFINVPSHAKDQGKSDSQSCLTSIKDILEEKAQSRDDYFQDLQCVAVEFVHALWSGHSGLAMEALKKDSDFWNWLCHHLFSADIDVVHPKIIAHIMRTLALEFFYVLSTTTSVTSDVGAQSVLNKIHSGQYLEKWSKYINDLSPSTDFIESRFSILDRSIVDEDGESFALYTAWRDFLLVMAKCEVNGTVKIPSAAKVIIMKDILDNLSNQILGENTRLMIMLSEAYLMLFHRWKTDLSSSVGDTLECVQTLLDNLSINSDVIHPRVQLAVVTICIYLIGIGSKSKEENVRYFDQWVSPTCKLLKKSSLLIDKAFTNKDNSVLKLPIAVISLLNKLVEETQGWLPIVKAHVVMPLLVSLLTKCLKLQFGFHLALTIISLFTSVAATIKAAEALCNTGFMNEITLILSVVDFSSFSTSTTLVPCKKVTVATVYYSFLRLMRRLLHSLGNYFLQDALNFVAVHLEIFHAVFNEVKSNPLSCNLEDIALMCSFLHELSSHQEKWRLEHPKSFEILLNDVSFCSNAVIALLMRPNMLKNLIERKEPKKSINVRLDPKLQRISTSEDDAMSSEKVVAVETELFKVLAMCLATMKLYSPGLHETFSNPHIDHSQWQLFLDLTFQTPSDDQECPASFGSIIASINTCLKWLTKHDKTPSPDKSVETTVQIERHLLLYVLEVSLTLMVSQCSLSLTHPDIVKTQKQVISRELSSELNILMQSANRYLRRGPLSPASTPSSQRTQQQASELPFIKLIENFVKHVLK